MAKVLGVLASARHLGNSEVLLRESLSVCQEHGLKTEIVRLTDLNMSFCHGCLRCILTGKECRIKDDIPLFLDKLLAFDAVIVAAPTYMLGPTGIVKSVTDRFLCRVDRVLDRRTIRPGAVISVAGLEEWKGQGLGQLSLFLLSFGIRPLGFMEAYAPGPGEVVLEKANIEKAREIGELISNSILNQTLIRQEVGPNRCPVCFGDVFRFLPEGTVHCPNCGLEGELTDSGISFPKNYEELHRFTWEHLQSHIEDWVKASAPRYLASRKDIQKEIINLKEKWGE